MSLDQEQKLFKAIRLILKLLCILVYNQCYRAKDNGEIAPSIFDRQIELEQEASRFADTL